MRIKKLAFPLFFASAVFVASCSQSKPAAPAPTPPPPAPQIPDWVTVPYLEGGIAATRCVAASRSINVDQSQSTALARAELSRQLGTRVAVMDKTFDEKISTNKGDAIGGTFTAVSKQISQNYLKGSRPVKANYVNINDQRVFCTMIGLDPNATDDLVKAIVEGGTTKDVSAQDKEVLYQEFKAYKAQQELDQALAQ